MLSTVATVTLSGSTPAGAFAVVFVVYYCNTNFERFYVSRGLCRSPYIIDTSAKAVLHIYRGTPTDQEAEPLSMYIYIESL